jgi:hypothetical protein
MGQTSKSPAAVATADGASGCRARQLDGSEDNEGHPRLQHALAAWITAADPFDWASDDAIVVPEQRGLAVYTNGSGAVVVRQQQGPGDREDVWIVIRPEHAQTIATAILREVGAAMEPASVPLSPAALRQRRYREKQRNGSATPSGLDDDPLPLVVPDRA